MGAEGDSDGFVFVGDDVLFEQGAVEFFEVDLEARGAAVWRAESAELVADFVDAGAGSGAGRGRPSVGATEDVPWPHFEADFIEEAEFGEAFAVGGGDGVFVDGGHGSAEGLRGSLAFAERRWRWGVGFGEDGFGGGEVFFDVGGGECED